MRRLLLVAAVAAGMSGCASGVYRSDAADVRSIEMGGGRRILVVEDPITKARCYLSQVGMSCAQAVAK